MRRNLPHTNSGNRPKTRKEAIDCGEHFFFTGKPCKHGHVSTRYANSGACTACQQEHSKKIAFPDIGQGTAKLRDIDELKAEKTLERSLKEVWDE